MNAIELEVQSREARKRNSAKALRSSGRVPGVVYGGSDNQLVEVEHKVFERIMQAASSDTVLLDLKFGKDKRLALVQEVQHHPVSREPLHIDFREVKPDQKVIVTLPTVPVGEAVGVKTGGGNLEHVLRYVKVKGTPTSLPEVIETDIAKLDIGQTLLVRDMVVPEGVEILADPSNAVFSVTRPRVVAVSVEDQALAEGASEDGVSSDKAKDESSGGEGDK
tara:strand:+ start:73 stop:735 length:663 start_codon:yes stop_codon:yes gene_type:complete